MADSVGTAYITAVGDTSQLEDDFEKGGERAGERGGKSAADKFDERFQEHLKKRLKKMEIEVPLALDDENFRKQLREAGTEGRKILRDMSDAKAYQKALSQNVENSIVEGAKKGGTKGGKESSKNFNDEFYQSLKKSLPDVFKRLNIEVPVNVDSDNFEAELEGLAAASKKFSKQIANAKEYEKALKISLQKGADKNEKGAVARMRQMGAKMGQGLAGGLETVMNKTFGRLSKRMRAILTAIAAFAEQLTVGIYSLGGSLVALSGSALQAISGLAALQPILVGMGAALVGVVLGAGRVTDAFGAMTDEFGAAFKEGRKFNREAEGIQKALENMGPEARRFSEALLDSMEPLSEFRSVAEAKLFAGLGREMEYLNQKALPEMIEGFGMLLDSVNAVMEDGIRRMANFNWDRMFREIKDPLETTGMAFNTLIEAFFEFTIAAGPAAQRLADNFREMANSLLRMVEAGQQSGSINEWLSQAITSGEKLWAMFRSLGSALWTLINSSAVFGDSMVESLTDVFDRWNNWMKSVEGQTAMTEFFTLSIQGMKAFAPLLKGIADGLSTMFTGDSLVRFTGLMEDLGYIIEQVLTYLSIFGGLGVFNVISQTLVILMEALEPLLPLLGELATVIGGALGQAIGAIVPLFAQLIEAILPFVMTLITILMPYIQRFTDEVLPLFVDAFAPLLGVLGQVVGQILSALLPVFELLLNIFLENQVIIMELVGVFAELLVALLPILPPLVEIIALVAQIALVIVDALLPVIGFLIGIFTDLVTLFLRSVAPAIENIAGAISRMVEVFREAFQQIAHAIDRFWDGMRGLRDNIVGWVDGIFTIFSRVTQAITEPFQKAFDNVTRIVNNIKDAVASAVNAVASIPSNITGNSASTINLAPQPGPVVGVPVGGGTSRVINLTQNISTPAANPRIVAEQAMNDLVAAARL